MISVINGSKTFGEIKVTGSADLQDVAGERHFSDPTSRLPWVGGGKASPLSLAATSPSSLLGHPEMIGLELKPFRRQD